MYTTVYIQGLQIYSEQLASHHNMVKIASLLAFTYLYQRSDWGKIMKIEINYVDLTETIPVLTINDVMDAMQLANTYEVV